MVKCLLMKTFGDWLENEMNDRGWRPVDLANKARISRGSLSNIINDLRRPGPDICRAIANALQVPPEKVFRQAGLLPPKPETEEKLEEAMHLFQQLGEDQRKYVLQTLRALAKGNK